MLRSLAGALTVIAVAGWWLGPTAAGAPEAIERTLLATGEPAYRSLSRIIEFEPQEPLVAPSGGPPTWVLEPPPYSTQREKSVAGRGINPCLTPDPGFGSYTRWDRSPSVGQVLLPKDLKLNAKGEFPVVFHFHGHEAARKEWVQAIDGAVLVGIDLGVNSGPYLAKFADPAALRRLFESVEGAVASRLGVASASIGKLGLSSWSAGYGAVERILRSEFSNRVDSVMLLDGLHTGHADTERARRTLEPFVEYARRAANGRALFYVSHSSILPPGYASTTETASYLVWQLGGAPEPTSVREGHPMGLELIRRYDRGAFHVRGFSGNGKLDHCAQIGLYRDVLRRYLAPRWGLRLSGEGAEPPAGSALARR